MIENDTGVLLEPCEHMAGVLQHITNTRVSLFSDAGPNTSWIIMRCKRCDKDFELESINTPEEVTNV